MHSQPTLPGIENASGPESAVRSSFSDRDTEPGMPTSVVACVAELMIFPPIVLATASTSRAARLLARSRARLLVVVDRRRRPLGVVTPAELMKAVDAREPDSLARLTVRDIAITGAPIIPESMAVARASELLSHAGENYLVVVGPEGRLAGVIFAADLLGALV